MGGFQVKSAFWWQFNNKIDHNKCTPLKKNMKFCIFGKSQFHQIQPKYGLWNEQCITCICRVEVTTMAAQQDQELECLHGGPPRPPWLR